MKEKMLSFIVFFISTTFTFTFGSSLTNPPLLINLLPRNSTSKISTFDCSTPNFSTTLNTTKEILLFKSCDPFEIIPNLKLNPQTHTLSFEMLNNPKKLLKSQIIKIQLILNNKRPLLINIASNTTEINYEMNRGRLSESLRVNLFLSQLSDRRQAMNFAVRKNCAICLRLARIFDENYEKNLNYEKVDGGRCDDDCIRALFGLSSDFGFLNVPQKVFIYLHQNFLLNLKTYGSSVGKLVEKKMTVDEIKEEIELKIKLVGLPWMAWEQREFKVFDFLIRADCDLPENFLTEREKNETRFPWRNKFVRRVEEYLKEIEEFHEEIKNGNAERVSTFLKTHPNIHFARSTKNQSAIQTAYDSKQYEILSLLKGHGMSLGSLEELISQHKSLGNLTDETKEKIRQFNHDFTVPMNNDYIVKLIQQTSIYYDQKVWEKEKLIKVIQRAYEDVNEEYPEILKIVASSDQIEVIFNFEGDQIDDYDPTGGAVGIMSTELSYVIIGASDLFRSPLERNFVLGTIIHEFTHIAMTLIYENHANPYRKDDKEKYEKFRLVTESCEKKKDFESSISNAFTYHDEDGNGDGFHSELIARIPDMMLTYRHRPEWIRKLKDEFKELFEFYQVETLPDMLEMIPKMAVVNKIRDFNDWFEILKDIESFNLEVCRDSENNTENTRKSLKSSQNSTKNTKNVTENLSSLISSLSLNPDEEIHAIFTNSPSLALIDIIQEVKSRNINAIYTSLKFTELKNIIKTIYDIDLLKTEIVLVVYCNEIIWLETFMDLIEGYSIEQVIFVSEVENREEFKEFPIEVREINYDFNDLCEDSKEKVLEMEITHQGFEVSLKNAVKELNNLTFLSIDEIITETSHSIGNELDNNEEYLIPLKFVTSEGEIKDLKEIVSEIFEIDGVKAKGKLQSEDNFEDSRENWIFSEEEEDKMNSTVEFNSGIFRKKDNVDFKLNELQKHRKAKKTIENLEIKKIYKEERLINRKKNKTLRFGRKSQSTNLKKGFKRKLNNKDQKKTIRKSIAKKQCVFNQNQDLKAKNLFRSPQTYQFSTLTLNPDLRKDISSKLNSSINPSPQNQIFEFLNSSSLDFNYNTLNETSQNLKTKNSKIFLISSPPGSGKSVALNEIGLEIKAFNPATWVIKINVADFDEFSESDQDDEEILEFLSGLAGDNEESRGFLHKTLKNTPEKIFLLIDEFNSLKNQENSLKIIKKMENFSNHIFIACRPNSEVLIKKKLKIEKTLQISSLDHKDREMFLEYFSHLNATEEEKLTKFLEENNVENIKFLHEIVSFWDENFYLMFVNILRQRFDEFSEPHYSDFQRLLSYNSNLMKFHQQLAIKKLPVIDIQISKQFSSLKFLKENFPINIQDLLTFGLIYKEKSEKFINKLIQEFFIAQFLIENYKEPEVGKILMDMKENGKFVMILRFLKDFLDLNEADEQLRELVN